jgi:hypothetical protein
MGAVQLAAAKHTPCKRTWVSGCYFDFEQEFHDTTEIHHRLYLRHRSDGEMFYSLRRMDSSSTWSEDMFDFLLVYDDPCSLAYTDAQFRDEVKRLFTKSCGHDLVWEMA